MAALKESVTLTGLPCSSEFLSISSPFENDCIIISYKNGQAYLYQVQDQRVVSSWSCRHNTQLTSAVIQVEEDQYAAIVNHQILRTWNKDELLIDKGKKTTLKKRAHCLCATSGHFPLVLFSDGSLSTMAEAKECNTDGPLENADRIVWYSLMPHEEDAACLAVLVKGEKNDYKLLVHWLLWGGNSMKTTHLLVNLENSIAGQMLSWDTFCCPKGELSLLALVLEPATDPSYHLMRLTFKKDSYLSKCESICSFQAASADTALVAAGDSHVVVAGLEDRTLTLNKDCFGLIDTKFAAVQRTVPFPSGCNRISKTYKTNSYIIATDGKLSWALPYASGPSRLGDLFGKFSPKAPNSPCISDIWHWSKSTGKQDAILESIEESVVKLSDSTKISSMKAFSTEFAKLMSHLRQLSPQAQPVNISTVISRCLEETKFWPRSEVKELIASGYVPARYYDALVSKLIEKEDISLLSLCLDSLKEIPESVLTAILQCFLRTEETQFVEPLKSSGTDQEGPFYFRFHKASAINKILMQPFNDVFLLECLKAINFEEAKTLMNYLASIIHGSNNPLEINIQLPSITQVVDWINLCLDAHFAQWCLSTDTRELLLNLAQVTEAKQKFYDELQSLDAILSQLKKKCDLPKKKIGQYCITTLHM